MAEGGIQVLAVEGGTEDGHRVAGGEGIDCFQEEEEGILAVSEAEGGLLGRKDAEDAVREQQSVGELEMDWTGQWAWLPPARRVQRRIPGEGTAQEEDEVGRRPSQEVDGRGRHGAVVGRGQLEALGGKGQPVASGGRDRLEV